jgi:stage II sporulation protein D (peptidoglycan lytic transglycosylase)
MKWCPCALAAAAVVVIAGCSDIRPLPIKMPEASVPRYVRVKATPKGPVVRVSLEDYVRAAILSEFAPPSGDPGDIERMLEVQAVIARTYATAHLGRHQREGYDLCSTTHCQLYQPARLKTSSWAPLAEEAAAHTAGMVLWYGTGPASALFHADCGGHTSAAVDIWGGTARPYLKAAVDDGAAQAAHTTWRYEAQQAEIMAALNADARTRVGKELREIKIAHRDDGGRAVMITLKGTREVTVRGEDLRAVLTNAFGAKSIRSARFDVSKQGTRFVFTGKGYGHGVGLCQAGAYARLRAGALPEQVLARYYPGTRLIALP